MDPMLEAFIQESRENLEAAGACFLELEKSPSDAETMNDLFRSIHTMKGSSGLFDIAPFTRVVHAAEDVLDVARGGGLELTPEAVDLFLDSLDQVSIWVDNLERKGELPDTAEAEGQILSKKLRTLLGSTDTSDEAGEPQLSVESTEQVNDTPKWFEQIDDSARLACFSDADDDVLAIVYTPSEDCFFNGDDPVHTVQGLQGLKWFSIHNNNDWGDEEKIDPFLCNLHFYCLVNAKEMVARDYLKYVAEQVTFTKLQPTQLIIPVGDAGDIGNSVVYEALLEDASKAIEQGEYDSLKRSIKPLLEMGSAELIQTSALLWMQALLNQSKPLKYWLEALLDVIRTGTFTPPNDKHLDEIKAYSQSDMQMTRITPITSAQDVLFSENIPESIKNIFDTQLRILNMPCIAQDVDRRVLSTISVLKQLFNQLGWQGLVPKLEDVGQISLAELSCASLAKYLHQCVTGEVLAPQHVSKDSIDSSKFIQDFFAIQIDILNMPHSARLLAGKVASTQKLLARIFVQIGWDDLVVNLVKAADVCIEQSSSQPLAESLQHCIHAKLSSEKITDKITDKVISDMKVTTSHTEEPVESTLYLPETETESVPDRREYGRRVSDDIDSKVTAKFLRVDQERIDTLMDLVGELVVAKNALPFLARRAEEEFKVKELGKEIKAQYSVINRLSEELQNAMMSVRMVPVSSVFKRFPRLVRDLSRRLEKNIELVMEGEETEADKNVIESLADPLIHLVRNSLDHGIEMPADRLAVGKPEKGMLILRAIPQDDQVIIEIIDDGKGIDPLVIKKKAYEKGVISEAQLDSISDQEAVELIFAAGLSSKDQASDLSGRGVGMDVVRSAVNAAGGSVAITSKLNVGSTIKLCLPLSMAVAQVMMIEVDKQVYGISMDMISETVRVPVEAIERIKNNEAIVLRDKLIPLRRLRDLLGLSKADNDLKEEAILIVTVFGEEIGLIIDDFHEGVDVIQKPLEGVMSSYPIYAGATLLGDGRVLLILDLKELL
jgi:two-component system chemotaxis sensor kinase CheA